MLDVSLYLSILYLVSHSYSCSVTWPVSRFFVFFSLCFMCVFFVGFVFFVYTKKSRLKAQSGDGDGDGGGNA